MANSSLPEDHFIQEGPLKSFSFSILGTLLLTLLVFFLMVGGHSLYQALRVRAKEDPFLSVTNRQFAIFLYQNPQFMKNFAKKKIGYLAGFDEGKLKVESADDPVQAPREILFFYHTWKRQISTEQVIRPIPLEEFKEFLSKEPAWKEKNQMSERAFQGWKNFYQEGEEINAISPTYEEMALFLSLHPHYNRQYWKNLVGDDYLKTVTFGPFVREAKVPEKELTPFLRVAFFNWKKNVASFPLCK